MRATTIALAFAASLFVVGCSSATAPLVCAGDCSCTATACTCQQGGTCTFGPVDGGEAPPSNVSISCSSQNTCDLSCGTNCSTTCASKTSCAGSCQSSCDFSCAGQS